MWQVDLLRPVKQPQRWNTSEYPFSIAEIRTSFHNRRCTLGKYTIREESVFGCFRRVHWPKPVTSIIKASAESRELLASFRIRGMSRDGTLDSSSNHSNSFDEPPLSVILVTNLQKHETTQTQPWTREGLRLC